MSMSDHNKQRVLQEFFANKGGFLLIAAITRRQFFQ